MSKYDDLLIFGYACKVFRDDERALSIDQGGHLIPWMGDPNLVIDRYDGRGHLSSLAPYEASKEPAGIPPEDVDIERMCDVERYQSMTDDDTMIDARREEETKRENGSAGAEVPFSYDQSTNAQPASAEENDELSVRTLANVIEKTAEFLVSQGVQMEILMRAKEANNPKFQFLNPDNPYHSIYKQVLEKKKSRSKGHIQSPEVAQQSRLEVENSLKQLIASLPNSAPAVSSIKYDQDSSDSAYSRLVEKIRENQPPPPPKLEIKQPKVEEVDKNSVEVQPPPTDIQIVIDQTASYVSKNGCDMMSIVRKRAPEKFSFLQPTHKYFNYYQYKVALYNEMNALEKAKKEAAKKVDGLDDPKRFPTLKGFFR